MTYNEWLLRLIADATTHGCFARIQQYNSIWTRIYDEGIEPSIASVCQWATQDPERFLDLRETEESIHQLAA